MKTDAAEALAQLAPMGAVEALAYWRDHREPPTGWMRARNTAKLVHWLWERHMMSPEWVVGCTEASRLITTRLYNEYLNANHHYAKT